MSIHDTVLFRLVSGAGKALWPGLMRLFLGCEVLPRSRPARHADAGAESAVAWGDAARVASDARESHRVRVLFRGVCGGFAGVCAWGGAAASGRWRAAAAAGGAGVH